MCTKMASMMSDENHQLRETVTNSVNSILFRQVLSATMKALERPQKRKITSLPQKEKLFTDYKITKDEDGVDCGLLVGIFSFR